MCNMCRLFKGFDSIAGSKLERNLNDYENALNYCLKQNAKNTRVNSNKFYERFSRIKIKLYIDL